MGIYLRICILIWLIQIVFGNNNTSTIDTTTINNSSERSAKALFAPYRRAVPLNYNNPVSNFNPNFSYRRNSVKSDANYPYQQYERHVTRNSPLVLNIGDYYPPYIPRENLKIPYPSQKQHFGNFFDASGYKIVSENPMSSFMYKKPGLGGYSKHYPSPMNYYSSPSTSYSGSPKIEPGTANFSQFNTRVKPGNILSDQYSKTYPANIKSHSIFPTFSPGLISPGGFKPINSPPHQSNPQVSERVRVFDTQPKTIYSTSFNNPGTLASAVENFPTHPVTSHNPSYGYQNSKNKINGINNYNNNNNDYHHNFNNNYQRLTAQPQLLFPGTIAPQQPVYQPQQLERIRSDVEVINKPKAPVTEDDADDEESSEEDFEISGKYPSTSEFDDDSFAPSSEKGTQDDGFNSFFSNYDKTFGKYSAKTPSKSSSTENVKTVEKPEQYGSSLTYINQPEQHVYENYKPEDQSSSYESYEYQDGSENHFQKRKNNKNDVVENDTERSDEKLPHHNSYRHDFTDEFIEGYKKTIPINEYAHVKEVPDINESDYKGKVSVSIKNPSKSVNKSREITQSKPKHQPYYIYTPAATQDEFTETSNEEKKTAELILESNFGHKIPKKKSQKNDDRGSEVSPKQSNETLKRGRFSSRGSPKN